MNGSGKNLTDGQCPYCGGTDVAGGLKILLIGESGSIGIAYKKASVFKGLERIHADLCLNCGGVVKFFVKEPKRDWVKEAD